MLMSFGKHKDKAVAWVLLKKPKYISWMFREGISCKEAEFANELIKKFDSMPYKDAKCQGTCRGKNEVTRLSLYQGNYNGEYWFCDECDEYSAGSLKALVKISKLSEALRHHDCEYIVAAMAKAKGAPKRKSNKALAEFFDYPND